MKNTSTENKIQTWAKIRRRGQFTVPYIIREKTLPSTEGEYPVLIELLPNKRGFIVKTNLTAISKVTQKKSATPKKWEEIEKLMKKCSKSGKRINLTNFLIKERISRK